MGLTAPHTWLFPQAYEKQRGARREEQKELQRAAAQDQVRGFLEKEAAIVSRPLNPFTPRHPDPGRGNPGVQGYRGLLQAEGFTFSSHGRRGGPAGPQQGQGQGEGQGPAQLLDPITDPRGQGHQAGEAGEAPMCPPLSCIPSVLSQFTDSLSSLSPISPSSVPRSQKL